VEDMHKKTRRCPFQRGKKGTQAPRQGGGPSTPGGKRKHRIREREECLLNWMLGPCIYLDEVLSVKIRKNTEGEVQKGRGGLERGTVLPC